MALGTSLEGNQSFMPWRRKPEEKVYVAVGRDVEEGRAMLLWALENFSREQKIVLAHVHRPARMIPTKGRKLPAILLKKQELRTYRQLEREKMHKMLDDYQGIGSNLQVETEQIVIQMDDVAKGLLDLIARFGITKLVMGATVDKHYSKNMETSKSKTAISVKCRADLSCNIWFVCKGHLICTRETHLDAFGSLPSPLASQSSTLNQYGHLNSRYSSLEEGGSSNRPFITIQDVSRHKSRFHKIDSHGAETIAAPAEPVKASTVDERFSAEGNIVDSWETRRTHESPHDLLPKDKERAVETVVSPSVQKSNEDLQYLTADEESVDAETNAEVYHKLKQALAEIDNLKHEAFQESCRHWEAERDAADAIQKLINVKLEHEEASCKGNYVEFSYSELEEATHGFSYSLKMGEGSYKTIYKGLLRKTMVAIKFLNPESEQAWSEFYRELGILSRVRHPNLITLIGACTEACALIYEFLPHGSLEDHLSRKNKKDRPLTWQIRTRIAAEVCSALIYLHSHQPHPMVHGDLNPDKILLDANFISKLTNIGYSQLPLEELSPDLDIYSFGIIILRLLTGMSSPGIVEEVKEAVNKGSLNQIVDASAGEWPFIQAKQLAYLGLRCCEAGQNNQPDLSREVWRVLERFWKSASSTSTLSFESFSDDNSCMPNYFICPIFQEIMRDPHVAADGFTYEAEALKGWFGSGHDTSPMTNLKLPNCDLVPNHSLRSAIQEWIQQQRA